jgi:hypothetical protein
VAPANEVRFYHVYRWSVIFPYLLSLVKLIEDILSNIYQQPRQHYIYQQSIQCMLENIAYVGLGFAAVFLALEAAWHFTACKINDKSIKPCLYKQIGILK